MIPNLLFKLVEVDGHKIAVPCESIIELDWSEEGRRVGEDFVSIDVGVTVRISTVFLGINHGPFNRDPILFETMIFGGENNHYQRRYETWVEAVEGHKEIVETIKQKTNI